MDAKAQISDQAKRYGAVVCSVNKALVGGSEDQLDAVKAFLEACPEEDKGQLLLCLVWLVVTQLCYTLSLPHLRCNAHGAASCYIYM